MKIDYNDLTAEKISDLLSNEKTFEVTGLSGRMSDAVEWIENEIEAEGLRCRIYTYGRVAAAGGTLFGGITGLLGLHPWPEWRHTI